MDLPPRILFTCSFASESIYDERKGKYRAENVTGGSDDGGGKVCIYRWLFSRRLRHHSLLTLAIS